jgi:hypothetical protein
MQQGLTGEQVLARSALWCGGKANLDGLYQPAKDH